MASERILILDDDNFDDEIKTIQGPILVDFWANWCEPCKTIAPWLDQLADDLAAKQADLNSKKDKPAELRARLELLKRGSGRIEKKKPDTSKPAPKSGEATGGKKESS